MLTQNTIAPDFTLPEYQQGESHFYDQSKTSVLVFYKFSCGTCRFTFPFLEKIYQAYGDAFYFVAIAQDTPDKVTDFRKELKITIPTLMDMAPFPVSREYQLDSVPSIFLVNPDHKILYSGDGFVKQDILNLADTLAEKSGRNQIDVFDGADVPEVKPG